MVNDATPEKSALVGDRLVWVDRLRGSPPVPDTFRRQPLFLGRRQSTQRRLAPQQVLEEPMQTIYPPDSGQVRLDLQPRGAEPETPLDNLQERPVFLSKI